MMLPLWLALRVCRLIRSLMTILRSWLYLRQIKESRPEAVKETFSTSDRRWHQGCSRPTCWATAMARTWSTNKDLLLESKLNSKNITPSVMILIQMRRVLPVRKPLQGELVEILLLILVGMTIRPRRTRRQLTAVEVLLLLVHLNQKEWPSNYLKRNEHTDNFIGCCRSFYLINITSFVILFIWYSHSLSYLNFLLQHWFILTFISFIWLLSHYFIIIQFISIS